MKKRVVEEADQKNRILTNLKESDVLEELNVLHTEGVKLVDPTDKSGAFRGRDKVHEHLLYMIKNAKKNVTLMTSKDGLDRKYDLLNNHLRKAVKAGIDVRVSVPQNANPDFVKQMSEFATVKQHKNGNARFCVVDGKDMLLFLTDDQKVHKSYDCAVWVEAPHFIDYFMSLFNKDW
ncbi:TPA: hypothetical protein HA241_05180 [Candidatus Woesearchaeota archaeon]|nr:hypothetical protein [Candidatus Woesearchaeota archaeon]